MTAGRLELFGRDPRRLSEAERRKLLGRSLAIVYQDPMSSLNPALRVGGQLGEVAEVHYGLSRKEAAKRSIDRLRSVRIGSPEARVRQYPHEFSGGMRQRAVIAMGLMIEPKLIVADEPTTALDVTVQQQILRLLRDVSASSGSAAIFISHDVAVVSQICTRVVVMYAGRVVEELASATLASGPAHPYTAALVASVPTMESDRSRPLATIPGRAPGPEDRSPGCPFATRCPRVTQRCRDEMPPLDPLAARGTASRAGIRSCAPRTRSRRDGARGQRPDRALRARRAAADGCRPRRPGRARGNHGGSRRRVGLREVDGRTRPRRAGADYGGGDRARRANASRSGATAASPIRTVASR